MGKMKMNTYSKYKLIFKGTIIRIYRDDNTIPDSENVNPSCVFSYLLIYFRNLFLER